MRKLRLPFLRQYYIGNGIGGLLDTYQRAAGILGTIQYVAMIIVLYTTSVQPFAVKYLPWLTFTVYMTVAIVGIGVVMILVYMVAGPSSFAFWSQQIWKHDNPMRQKMEDMEKKQVEMDKKLDAIARKLDEGKVK